MRSRFDAIAISLLLSHAFVTIGFAESTASNSKTLLEIRKVGLDRKVFDPSKGQTVSLTFEINREADVFINIYDRLGQEVYCSRRPELKSGKHSITWDGRDSEGKPARGKVFLYVIRATAHSGEKAVYNPAERTGGFVAKTHSYTFDKKTGKIEYVLPKACMIRLRAGLKEGMLARTLYDWEPRNAGRHVEKWDGKDVSGLMNISNHPDLNLILFCYTLPANTIINTSKVISLQSERKLTKTESEKRNKLWATLGKYFHYQHDPRVCHEPRFTVSFPVAKKANSEGVPVLSGATPIRMELDKRDARHLLDKRFEIMIYVDGVFLFEMEEGTNPFTFYWDTHSFAKGDHTVTVNVLSYDDHIGVVTQKVVIGEE